MYYICNSFPKMNVICILEKGKARREFPGVDGAIRIRTIRFGIINNIQFLSLYLCLLRCDCNFDAEINDISLKKKQNDPTQHLIC